MSEEVTRTRDGHTAIVTINRPEARNSLTKPVVEKLGLRIKEAADDKAVRCVIIAGSGGHFSSGADLKKRSPRTRRFSTISIRTWMPSTT